MAQLAQSLRFDLADALAGDGEGLADFFEGVLAAIFEAKAHLDDFFFARRKGAKHLRGLVVEVDVDDGLGGRDDCLSSMKSPRCESSSSPMGVSSEMGSLAIFRTLRTLSTGRSICGRSLRWSARGPAPAPVDAKCG